MIMRVSSYISGPPDVNLWTELCTEETKQIPEKPIGPGRPNTQMDRADSVTP